MEKMIKIYAIVLVENQGIIHRVMRVNKDYNEIIKSFEILISIRERNTNKRKNNCNDTFGLVELEVENTTQMHIIHQVHLKLKSLYLEDIPNVLKRM